jgi:hypothetical protein
MPHSCPTCGGSDACPKCGRSDAWDGTRCNRCRTSSARVAAPPVPIIDATLVDEAPVSPANRRRREPAYSASTVPASSPRPRRAADLPKHSNFASRAIVGLLCFAFLLVFLYGVGWFLEKRGGSGLVGKWEHAEPVVVVRFDQHRDVLRHEPMMQSLTYEFYSNGTGVVQKRADLGFDIEFDWSLGSVDKKLVLLIDTTKYDSQLQRQPIAANYPTKASYHFTTQGNTLTLIPLEAPEKAMTFQKIP